MKRRDFIAASGLAALSGLTFSKETIAEGTRDFYELRRYTFDTDSQVDVFHRFMRDAAMPALNRIGISDVGVFMGDEKSPIYLLLKHTSLESIATLRHKILSDDEFVNRGSFFLDAPAENPAYNRVAISIMLAFSTMPRLEKPVTSPDRVVQLRIYASPSVKTGQKKIEIH